MNQIELTEKWALHFLNSFGIECKNISEVVIKIKAGELPTVVISRFIDQNDAENLVQNPDTLINISESYILKKINPDETSDRQQNPQENH